MSTFKAQGNASGTGEVTLETPNTNTNRTISLPDATTTLVGTDATQTLTNKTLGTGITATTQSNGDNSTKPATTAYVQNMGLGWGQSWQDVTGSRAVNTPYQNTTGKPIVFSIQPVGNSSGGLQVSSDGSTYVTAASASDYSSATNSAQVIVPPNHYYRFSGTGFYFWTELR